MTNGDLGRYARLEDEQRFLLRGLPAGLEEPRLIVDRYLIGTRLRLREVTAEGRIVRKLGHKVCPDPRRPSRIWHTTCYLDEAELEMLASLPTHVLTKRRWTVRGGGCVDELLGPLEGLILAEGERPLEPPFPHAGEVTDDQRFGGGALAALDAEGLKTLLAGIARPA